MSQESSEGTKVLAGVDFDLCADVDGTVDGTGACTLKCKLVSSD
jgi:hypothetical protein